MSPEEKQRVINRWAGRIVPLVLLGVTGYSIWVLVDLLCVQYLLNPKYPGLDVPRRTGIAISILVLYCLFLLPYLVSYLRILQLVVTDPGYIQQRHDELQNVQYKEEKRQSFKWACSTTTVVENAEFSSDRRRRRHGRSGSESGVTFDRAAILDGSMSPPPGIERFYSKDVFVCDPAGLPIYCGTCKNWKPDRTHHCSEVGRCVRRMDHFCPWVGGVVSETTMKSFIIFTFYASLFCAFLFGVMVWAIVDRKNRTGGINGNWLAAAAAAGLFGFIAIGMFGNTIRQQLSNQTTIEFLGSGERFFFIAVLVSPSTRPTDEPYPMITYPLPSQRRADERRHDLGQEEARIGSESRQFAVLQSRPEYNIWNCGRLNNLKSVLGERYIDWILPIRYPPCCSHDNGESDFPLGEDFEKLKSYYGLPSTYAGLQRKRRRRRSSHQARN